MLSQTAYKNLRKKSQDQIDNQRKNILKNKQVIDRIFVKGKQNCFIMLKDNKPNSETNLLYDFELSKKLAL